jgi:methylated-DNA-[protein]-cysteine S-methyltransferase
MDATNQRGKSRQLPSPVFISVVDPTPLGPIWVAVSERGLLAVEFVAGEAEMRTVLQRRGYEEILHDQQACATVARQLREYLAGERSTFDLEVDWTVMTPFQEQALRATFAIPYGQINTYAQVARQIGKPRAARAVGRAEATNPMPLVIPCHRVVGSDGALHGYGGRGGLDTKAWLLRMESGKETQVVKSNENVPSRTGKNELSKFLP